MLGFLVWPVGRWIAEHQLSAHQRLVSEVRQLTADLASLRIDYSDQRNHLALHRQEDATHHARLDGELAALREKLAALPTGRDIGRLMQAIERMRAEVGTQLASVAGDLKVVEARVADVREMLERTEKTVDRHEQIMSSLE